MKALFTTFPAHGHLLPMLSLARAAVAAGDEVVVATSKELHATGDGLVMRGHGPALAELLAENARRSGQDVLGYRSDGADLLQETIALFTSTWADLAFDDLCDVVEDERPDVIVAEMWDYLGPMAARRFDIPLVSFVHSPATAIDALLEGGLAKVVEQRGLAMPVKAATVQLWPEWLESEPGIVHDAATIAIRTVPHQASDVVDIPAFDGERPVVLVTLGTVVEDLDLLNAAVRGVLDAGADALVTTGFATSPEQVEGDPDRVRAVSFAPIGQLLDRVQAVVTAGGSGTTLAALSRGLPLAFVPRMANQPLVASVVAGFGAGIVCDDPATVTAAVTGLLTEPRLRERAAAAAELLDQRLTADAAWSAVRDRTGLSAR